MDSLIARKTWRTLEPLHGFIYFAPEANAAYEALGLNGLAGYFASRSAAMGPVPAQVVVASFFNFNPVLVHAAIPRAWEIATPSAIIEARMNAVHEGLVRLVPEAIDSPEIAEAAELASVAAHAARNHLEGRPLFAAHAAQPWPEQPHLALWHAQMLLREFRGDGHVAILTANGFSGLEALALHAATKAVRRNVLQATRGWSDDDWAAAVGALHAKGLLDAEGEFTDQGREIRESIEDQTDLLALPAYQALGEDGCQRLRELARPWSTTIATEITL